MYAIKCIQSNNYNQFEDYLNKWPQEYEQEQSVTA